MILRDASCEYERVSPVSYSTVSGQSTSKSTFVHACVMHAHVHVCVRVAMHDGGQRRACGWAGERLSKLEGDPPYELKRRKGATQ